MLSFEEGLLGEVSSLLSHKMVVFSSLNPLNLFKLCSLNYAGLSIRFEINIDCVNGI